MKTFALEWQTSPSPVAYEDAVHIMETRVQDIRTQDAPGLIWFLEHPPLYTAGTSARSEDLLKGDFPVYSTGRGGQFTYHGPGQRVAYVMMDLKALFAPHPPDLRRYIALLEAWVIAALAKCNMQGFTREGRVGVWVEGPPEAKIAAIGVRVRSWVAYHGIAVNVHPDLSHYQGIVPCGIKEYGVTSLHEQGVDISLKAFDEALKSTFPAIFFA